MKKNKGYTLAEMLIALGIVGVISAIIIPGLSNEYNNKVNASALSSAVTSFETAISSLMAENNTNNVYDTPVWKLFENSELTSGSNSNDIQKFTDQLGTHLKITGYESNVQQLYQEKPMKDLKDNSDINITSLNGNNNQPAKINFKNSVCFYTENGINYFIYIPQRPNDMKNDNEYITEGVQMANVSAQVFIDVNGYEQRPNKVGRDIFGFVLGSNGTLYPYGGRDVMFHLKNNPNGNNVKIWSETSSDYACTNNQKKGYGFGCTARLIENGYKMDY